MSPESQLLQPPCPRKAKARPLLGFPLASQRTEHPTDRMLTIVHLNKPLTIGGNEGIRQFNTFMEVEDCSVILVNKFNTLPITLDLPLQSRSPHFSWQKPLVVVEKVF